MLNVLSETRSDDSLRKRPIKPPFLPCLSLPPTPYNTTETGPILFTKETHTTKMPPNTIEAKEHSPTLSRLLKARPAPSRETNLLNAAFSTTKPIKPPPGECCGSSCDPCVMDLYAQELKVWKECAAYREVLGEVAEIAEVAESEDSEPSCKIPGAFEW
jgi:hypothetical protein